MNWFGSQSTRIKFAWVGVNFKNIFFCKNFCFCFVNEFIKEKFNGQL